jgi:phosphoglucomutase
MVDVLVDEDDKYWTSPEGVAQIVKAMLAHIEKVETERDNWQETARRYCKNADYWRVRAQEAENDLEHLASLVWSVDTRRQSVADGEPGAFIAQESEWADCVECASTILVAIQSWDE